VRAGGLARSCRPAPRFRRTTALRDRDRPRISRILPRAAICGLRQDASKKPPPSPLSLSPSPSGPPSSIVSRTMRRGRSSSTRSGWMSRSSWRPVTIASLAVASFVASSGSVCPRSAAISSSDRTTGPSAAPVKLHEALTQLGVTQHVGPELEEDGEPAVVSAPAELPAHALEALVDGVFARERGLHLRDPAVDPARVDREEEVLLRAEVRVDRALRVRGIGSPR